MQIPGIWMVASPEHPELPFSFGSMPRLYPGFQSELQNRFNFITIRSWGLLHCARI